ncbi:hypothetical protein LCGC14_1947550, partial [marine sediment metagenome]
MATKLEIRHELEWRACKNSFLYFIENYWMVATVGVGYDIMHPWPYQIDEINAFQAACEGTASQRQNRLKARQLGWTTMA